MIKKTQNYELFKKHPNNRPIDQANVKRLIASIQSRNLLEYRPMLVDAQHQVIDGQHRLEAAKKLDLPIYYEVQEDMKIQDIILLNANQKNWTSEDYLNYYAGSSYEEYVKLEHFIKKHDLLYREALWYLGFNGGKYVKDFRQGKYKHPSREREEEALHKKWCVENAISFIRTKKGSTFSIVNGRMFKEAMIVLFSKTEVEFDIFMSKLELAMERLKICSSVGNYLNVFIDIYNFKNRNPIERDK